MRNISSVLVCLAVAGTFASTVVSGAPQLAPLSAAGQPARNVLAPGLAGAVGEVDIVVQLDDPSLATLHSVNAKGARNWLPRSQQTQHLGLLKGKHDALAATARSLGGSELGRLSKALNAVILRIDASHLPALAALPNVISIRPVVNYHLDDAETIPYVGASAVRAGGIDGTGVRAAVIDTGIDYTHKDLGGPGTLAAYVTAYGTNSTDPANTQLNALFPSAKVIGGFDFVGETWPNGPLAPDPNPIDFNGHGTHVADILAGHSQDDTHHGVAPGAKLFALRACSSIASACSGVALLQSMDFALDPDGDGDLSDAVDVINLSLGSAYGQKEDDLSQACANAVHLGVIVVAAAGNDGDKPYVLSSPASTPEVIAAAQTQVPSAKQYPLVINSPASIAGAYPNTATVDWAPVGAGFTGDVAYVGRGCSGDAYLANPSGKVALIDRGSCAVSLKVDRAAKAGAIGVLIAMVNSADPISFSFGGGTTFVPTLVIPKSVADRIKANLAAPVNVTFSPSNFIALVGSMVNTSARGPSYSYQAIKPDVGAPGGTISAQVGTGDGETAFGGTSGATPMIAGCAALLREAFPGRSPAEIKSLLMNSAETTIQTDPALQPGVLAPITRIGGGEVRVDRAVHSTTAAWDAEQQAGSLSFGYHAISGPASFERTVVVRNYSDQHRTYNISSGFRYANDAANGAVSIKTPSMVRVGAHSMAQFQVELDVDASKLPDWDLNGGPLGGAGPLLQGVEFDGYVHIADKKDDVHLAWQILPHKAAAVSANLAGSVAGEHSARLMLDNQNGATAGGVEVFSLTGQSSRIPRRFLPGPGDNFAVIDLQAVGVRLVDLGGEPGVQFAVTTFGQRSHPNYPALFDVAIDTNLDGVIDFEVFNNELGGFAATGQNVVFVQDDTVTNPSPVVVEFADADLDSANVILTAPLSAIGLAPGSQFKFSVFAVDDYFTGNITDAITDMAYTLGTPAFSLAGSSSFALPPGARATLGVSDVAGGETASPSQSGLLLLYRDAKANQESQAVTLAHRRGDNSQAGSH
ncbi:MAG TPA: S8 family serine peptidase [Candidatus Acidoferrum sp.]|jgi:minor extracellular serine protease Vpr|nr:S8 family serine peptidase [Candidatus Acidoferrum sp.]